MAPQATEWTPFEKYRGAYAGAVFCGKSLQMEYQPMRAFASNRWICAFCNYSVIKQSGFIASHVKTASLNLVAFSGYNLVLQFSADGCEIGVVAGNADQQMFIVLRIFLGIP